MVSRKTIQRALVYEAVNHLKSHATAEEIFHELSREYPAISRATVYRNLNILHEEGKIRRIAMTDGPDCFDHVPQQHYHVRCEKCGHVFDVDMDILPDLEKHIRDSHGFQFTSYDLLFHGICPSCRALMQNGGHHEKQDTI